MTRTATKMRKVSAERPLKTTMSPVVAGVRNSSLKALRAVKAASRRIAADARTGMTIFLRLALAAIEITLRS
jgi:hypothetical protein